MDKKKFMHLLSLQNGYNTIQNPITTTKKISVHAESSLACGLGTVSKLSK